MSSDNLIQESIEESEEAASPDPLVEESKKSKGELEKPDSPVEEEEEDGRSRREAEEGGRERLKRHRVAVAGRVWIPDMWGHEDLLKDWIDCTAFDAPLVTTTILMARDSLAKDALKKPPQFRLHHAN